MQVKPKWLILINFRYLIAIYPIYILHALFTDSQGRNGQRSVASGESSLRFRHQVSLSKRTFIPLYTDTYTHQSLICLQLRNFDFSTELLLHTNSMTSNNSLFPWLLNLRAKVTTFPLLFFRSVDGFSFVFLSSNLINHL